MKLWFSRIMNNSKTFRERASCLGLAPAVRLSVSRTKGQRSGNKKTEVFLFPPVLHLSVSPEGTLSLCVWQKMVWG